MSRGDDAGRDGRLYGRASAEQPQRLRDRHAMLAEAIGHLFMSEAELFDEAAQPASLLDRVQVGALQILDKAEHELRVIVCVTADDRGHGGEPREPGGSPSAFAGNELIPVRKRPHEQRLQDSMLAYRLGQLAERLRIETRPDL